MAAASQAWRTSTIALRVLRPSAVTVKKTLRASAGIGAARHEISRLERPDPFVHRLRSNMLPCRERGIRDRTFFSDPRERVQLGHRDVRRRGLRLLPQPSAQHRNRVREINRCL